ncbi:MAG: phosphodiester glycosidase family protein [Bryobacteraceae bacterium]|nr:phosphodiester glycosidase family protein [Bryobacteraceae bacterium]
MWSLFLFAWLLDPGGGHWRELAPGVRYMERDFRRGAEGPFRLFALEIDPAHPAVNLLPVRALNAATGRETTSAMARRLGAVSAVNGGYFKPDGAAAGVFVWNGKVLGEGAGRTALLFCRERDDVERLEFDVVAAKSGKWNRAGRGCKATDITGAGPSLIKAGKAAPAAEGLAHEIPRHPRTAVARTSEGRYLFVVVDGRQPASAGMTLAELASELSSMGAVEALNLDGGGSTTLVAGGQVRNNPSDGKERPVGDAILVFSVASREQLDALEIATRTAPKWARKRLLDEARRGLRTLERRAGR